MIDIKRKEFQNNLKQNQEIYLKNLLHIKKYYKLRHLHTDIILDIENYLIDDKYPVKEYFNKIEDKLRKELNGISFSLDNTNKNDLKISNYLFTYKNIDLIPSIVEIFIENNYYKDAKRRNMLKCMSESIPGLFKVINCEPKTGYVTLRDVFTNIEYKIIDVATSSSDIKEEDGAYIYNRIITCDGISFGSGLPIFLRDGCKRLEEFIKNHKYEECSDFTRCIISYEISKDKDNYIIGEINNNF